MGTPHKHAAVIKAWADGAEIQCRVNTGSTKGNWVTTEWPNWYEGAEYRVKPTEPDYGQIAKNAWHNSTAGGKNQWNETANAVINAYHNWQKEQGS